jgi:histone-arginine methyltransferase CARM1
MCFFLPRQSYDVEISLTVDGAAHVFSNVLDLKNPFFRYTGNAISIPPGNFHDSPTDQYYTPPAVNTTNNNEGKVSVCFF